MQARHYLWLAVWFVIHLIDRAFLSTSNEGVNYVHE